MSRRAATIAVSSLLSVGLAVGGSFLPVPYLGLGPGPVFNTLGTVEEGGAPVIEIEGTKTYPEPANSRLDLTTVSVYGRVDTGLSLRSALQYWFDDDFAVVPKEILYPEDKSDDEVKREVAREMAQSQETATRAALRHLKVPATTTLVVNQVVPNAPAAKVLKAADVIIAIDGRRVSDLNAMRAAISSRGVGRPVRVTYRRAGREATAAITTIASSAEPRRAIIGIDVRSEATYPFTVKIDTARVGGPSAGLMLALGIIELLTPGSLTGGVHVAGTGTIDDDGKVGPIGGIQQKLVAAKAEGAVVFLTPAGNYNDALAAQPDGLELMRVSTLSEALQALQRIRTNR